MKSHVFVIIDNESMLCEQNIYAITDIAASTNSHIVLVHSNDFLFSKSWLAVKMDAFFKHMDRCDGIEVLDRDLKLNTSDLIFSYIQTKRRLTSVAVIGQSIRGFETLNKEFCFLTDPAGMITKDVRDKIVDYLDSKLVRAGANS